MNPSSWTHFNPVRIQYEPGGLARLAEFLDAQRAVLVTTPGFRRRGLVARVEAALGERLVAVIDEVKPNPDLNDVQAQGDGLRAYEPDAIIALGGGSTIDTGKALARLLALPAGSRLADLFAAGAAPVHAVALAIVAIPTTAGTGAEVTPFGTVWDYEKKKKCSVAGDDLYPKLALLDPELTLDLPESVTVSSGMDAISHALESAWNRNANPLSLGIVTRSLQLSLRALPRLKADPADREARAAMLQASTLAGLAISQTRTALAHAVSYPLTANFNLPHGIACSFTLPALLEFNACEDDGRLDELSRNLGYGGPAELAAGLTALLDRLGVNRQLAAHLPERATVMALADQMFAPGRAENNLRDATTDDVRALVSRSLDALGV
jgi:alcohol dehydrogenase